MCVFCVRIWLFKQLCVMYAPMRMLYGLCVRNTSFARKATFLYVYELCTRRDISYKYCFARKATYCGRIRLVNSKWLMRINSYLHVKLVIVSVYDLCTRSDLCIRVRLCAQRDLLSMYTSCALKATYVFEYSFAHKATYSSKYFLDSPTTVVWMLDDLSNVVMTHATKYKMPEFTVS